MRVGVGVLVWVMCGVCWCGWVWCGIGVCVHVCWYGVDVWCGMVLMCWWVVVLVRMGVGERGWCGVVLVWVYVGVGVGDVWGEGVGG